MLKRRRRDYMLKSAISTVKSSLYKVWQWILMLATIFTLPYQKLTARRRKSSHTSTGSSLDHSGLDNSLSDGECTSFYFIQVGRLGRTLIANPQKGNPKLHVYVKFEKHCTMLNKLCLEKPFINSFSSIEREKLVCKIKWYVRVLYHVARLLIKIRKLLIIQSTLFVKH